MNFRTNMDKPLSIHSLELKYIAHVRIRNELGLHFGRRKQCEHIRRPRYHVIRDPLVLDFHVILTAVFWKARDISLVEEFGPICNRLSCWVGPHTPAASGRCGFGVRYFVCIPLLFTMQRECCTGPTLSGLGLGNCPRTSGRRIRVAR